MAHNTNYVDLDEFLSSPVMRAIDQFFDPQKSILTPIDSGISDGSSSNSPQQEPTIEMPLSDDFEYPQEFQRFLQSCPVRAVLQPDGSDTSPAHNNGENDDHLQIIAQPTRISRKRYVTDSIINNGQGHRFIRADPEESDYEYPTVQFSQKYCNSKRELYIKVTPVTIITEKIREHYIHPYKIGSEGNYLTDDDNNSLYFPIQDNEFSTRQKELQITQTVTLQKNLKPPRPLYEHGTNLSSNQHNTGIQNPKVIITTYQLNKFQFVFAIAEKTINSKTPVSIPNTEVKSRIMIRESVDKKGKHANRLATDIIKCIPRKALWNYGEDVAITMTHPIKKKTYSIRFDCPLYESQVVTDVTSIDQKTFSFFAPPCPIPIGDHDLTVRMVINENDIELGYIEFIYIGKIIGNTNVYPRCQLNTAANQTCNRNKRTRDQVDSAVVASDTDISLGMNKLTLNENKSELLPASQTRSPAITSTAAIDDVLANFNRFIDQLQEALGAFVRTNDPSKLFRQHRSLLTSCTENPPPLHDAIEHGYISIVSTIIQQTVHFREPNHLLEEKNANGETVLLVGARCNEWKVIELIVKEREDMIEAKDNDDNNMLHLLASVKEDASAETLKNLFEILPLNVKLRLLKEANKENHIAKDIAQSLGNIQCLRLLSETMNLGESNN